MTQAHFVKKSRKAYKDSFTGQEIPAGSSYYWWAFNFGPTYISLIPPKPQQLTGSEYERTIMNIEEQIDKLDVTNVVDELESIKSQLEDLKTEQEEKLENMPEQLQESSSSGQMLQERIDELDGWISNLEDIDVEVDETSIREEIEQELADQIGEGIDDAYAEACAAAADSDEPKVLPPQDLGEKEAIIRKTLENLSAETDENTQARVDEELQGIIEQIQNAR